MIHAIVAADSDGVIVLGVPAVGWSGDLSSVIQVGVRVHFEHQEGAEIRWSVSTGGPTVGTFVAPPPPQRSRLYDENGVPYWTTVDLHSARDGRLIASRERMVPVDLGNDQMVRPLQLSLLSVQAGYYVGGVYAGECPLVQDPGQAGGINIAPDFQAHLTVDNPPPGAQEAGATDFHPVSSD